MNGLLPDFMKVFLLMTLFQSQEKPERGGSEILMIKFSHGVTEQKRI